MTDTDASGLAPIDGRTFTTPKERSAYAHLVDIINMVRERYPDASDIQFVGGDQVWVHENGEEKRTGVVMHDETLLTWAQLLGARRGGRNELANGDKGTLEIAEHVAGIRLRMTWRRQLGGLALNTRLLPSEPPTLDAPRFQTNPVPQELVDMVLHNRDGMILVEGPTGSGKSTLLAALVAEVNRTQARHIYTIEDPVEFVHTSNKSLVTQREVYKDTDSFFQGLQTAKRSKPGIILLGELRDPVTKRAALESAGEGHLVLATSHASSVPEAISTFIGAFPSDEQNDVSQRMAVSLRGVICQQLIPATNGKVVPVREMLSVTNVIASKLRDRETGGELRTVIMSSDTRQSAGTFSRDDDLLNLLARGLISAETVMHHAIDPKDTQARMAAMAQ